jgi:hypothetical protein
MAQLIDSDYDEDDEDCNSEMDEIFSLSPHHSDDGDNPSDQDSDDEDSAELKGSIGSGINRFQKKNVFGRNMGPGNPDLVHDFYNTCKYLFVLSNIKYRPEGYKPIDSGEAEVLQIALRATV